MKNKKERDVLSIEILYDYKDELEDLSFTYADQEGIYYKSKGDNKVEIDYETYRINTFMDEYLSVQ